MTAVTASRTPSPSGLLTQTLFRRLGWTPEFLAGFNDPSHPDLLDLDRMVAVLRAVHATRAKIVVMPDFDTDGVTSGTIAHAGLAQLGFDVELYIPDYRFGHDITPDAVADLIAKHPGVEVILTTDSGTNSHEGVAFGADHGIVMLVSDHHAQLPSPTPLRATVLVNPCRRDETYPHPGICGAHVVFQVVQAYTRTHAPAQVDRIERLALFAGMGTVADVMPLYYENRALVRKSLSLARLALHPEDPTASALVETIRFEHDRHLVADAYANAFYGFGQLMVVMTGRGIIRDALLKEDLYAFSIAPAINSARRILSDGGNAFRCFLSADAGERERAIHAILDDNDDRKRAVAHFMAELHSSDQPLAPHVWLTSAPTGMLGNLAGSLSGDLDLPVAVLNEHHSGSRVSYSGSGRAPTGVDIIAGFTPVEGISAIGHAQACGVRADDPDALALLAQTLRQLETDRPTPDPGTPFPGLVIGDTPHADSHHPTAEELLELIEAVEAVGPFGHGFPAPLHKVVLDPSRIEVTELGKATFDEEGNEVAPAGRHTRITAVNSGLRLVWWNSADARGELPDRAVDPHQRIEFLVRLAPNTFNGTTRPQGVVEARLR